MAEQALELRLLKKSMTGMGETRHEVSRFREARDHPARRAVAPCRHGAPWKRSAFHARPSIAGTIGIKLAARKRSNRPAPEPDRVWNRIPDDVRAASSSWRWRSPSYRRANWPCTSPTPNGYFVSEASVYRLLKAHDLITSPAFIVIKAADEFTDKTTAPNQLWQTDFTYLKIIGWGWFYLSTILDDFSRYIIAWKLCTTMKAEDVTDTLEHGADGIRLRPGQPPPQTTPAQRQWVELHRRRSCRMARPAAHGPCARSALSSPDPGQDRALAPDAQEPHPARKLLPAR